MVYHALFQPIFCSMMLCNIPLIHRFLNYIGQLWCVEFYIYVLQVSSLANWLNFLPSLAVVIILNNYSVRTTRLKNLQVIASFQHSTESIISISISTIQISFITPSDHCWYCPGRCIQERSGPVTSYLIYPNPNRISVKVAKSEKLFKFCPIFRQRAKIVSLNFSLIHKVKKI